MPRKPCEVSSVPKCSQVFPSFPSAFLRKYKRNLYPRKTKKKHPKTGCFGAAGRIRTADLILTKDALYLLSYSSKMATKKGLEPSTSGVTGRRSNQLSYLAIVPRPLFATEAYHTIKGVAVSSSFSSIRAFIPRERRRVPHRIPVSSKRP